ncbi:MAG: hypothetical protein M1825_003222 [Sarcosagium campestre]|nr:MAG: hypothetical protein M1825_003222 [Sarcosagium campestre]
MQYTHITVALAISTVALGSYIPPPTRSLNSKRAVGAAAPVAAGERWHALVARQEDDDWSARIVPTEAPIGEFSDDVTGALDTTADLGDDLGDDLTDIPVPTGTFDDSGDSLATDLAALSSNLPVASSTATGDAVPSDSPAATDESDEEEEEEEEEEVQRGGAEADKSGKSGRNSGSKPSGPKKNAAAGTLIVEFKASAAMVVAIAALVTTL